MSARLRAPLAEVIEAKQTLNEACVARQQRAPRIHLAGTPEKLGQAKAKARKKSQQKINLIGRKM